MGLGSGLSGDVGDVGLTVWVTQVPWGQLHHRVGHTRAPCFLLKPMPSR